MGRICTWIQVLKVFQKGMLLSTGLEAQAKAYLCVLYNKPELQLEATL